MATFVIILLITLLAVNFLKSPRLVGNKIIYIVLSFVVFYIGLKILDALFSFVGLGFFGGLISLGVLAALVVFSAGSAGTIVDKITGKRR